jgi:hypothetical protein
VTAASAKASAEAAAMPKVSAAPVHSVAHRLAPHLVQGAAHGMALVAAVPVHSMSHHKLLHAIRCV